MRDRACAAHIDAITTVPMIFAMPASTDSCELTSSSTTRRMSAEMARRTVAPRDTFASHAHAENQGSRIASLAAARDSERPSADHLKSGFREVPIEGKRHANTPIGHQDKAHGVDRRELVQIGPFEILPSMLEV
jgi:hypothetical protein